MTATETVTVQFSADPGEWMRLAIEALNPEPELRCESCPATDPDLFSLLEAGETDGDQLCDDCHHEHAAQAATDEANRRAYLYG